MNQNGLPAGYCPSCGNPLDVNDGLPMLRFNMCERCEAGSRGRRERAKESAVAAVTPTAGIPKGMHEC